MAKQILKELFFKSSDTSKVKYNIGADAENILIKNENGTAYGDTDKHKNLQSKLNILNKMIRTSSAEGYSHAPGTANGSYSTAFGIGTSASDHATHAEGEGSKAFKIGCHAEGKQCYAGADRNGSSYSGGDSNYAHAEGELTAAKGRASHAEGYNTKAMQKATHTEGVDTEANQEAAHAEGRWTSAVSKGAHSEGYDSVAGGTAVTKGSSPLNQYDDGVAAHAEGIGTFAQGAASHAEGYKSNALDRASHAEGGNTRAYGWYSHTEGYQTQTTKQAAHAEGQYTSVQTNSSHAEGFNNIIGDDTLPIAPDSTYAQGTAAHVEGIANVVRGTAAHAEGYRNKAYGDISHIEGKDNVGYGKAVHIEGIGNKQLNTKNMVSLPYQLTSVNSVHMGAGFTQTEGSFSIADSQYSYQYAPQSGSKGVLYFGEKIELDTYYKGYVSDTNNEILLSPDQYWNDSNTAIISTLYSKEPLSGQIEITLTEKFDYMDLIEGTHIQGTYNAAVEDCIHIVGNGTSDSQRSNAHTLTKYGAAYFQGGVSPSTIFLADVLTGRNYGIQIVNGELRTFVKTKGIYMTKEPTKMSYNIGDSFDISGASFVKRDESGSNFELSNDELSYTAMVPEDFKIQVSYIEHGFKYTAEIQVKEKTFKDFETTLNSDGTTYTVNGWSGTLNGQPSTKMVFPSDSRLYLSIEP